MTLVEPPAYRQIHRELAAFRRGEKAPARVFHFTLDASGRPVRKEVAPEAFRREQTAALNRHNPRTAR